MITFRYHLVTIVAVFLALGLGLLAGTTVIDQQLVDGLRGQIEQANRREAELSDELTLAQGERDRAVRALTDVAAADMAGRLAGRRVVLISGADVDPDTLARLDRDLSAAEATTTARLALSPRLTDPAAAGELDEILPGAAADPAGVVSEVLARRLMEGASAQEDVLAELLEGGFVVPMGAMTSDDLTTAGGPGQAVIFVGAGEEDPTLEVLEPLARSITDRGGMIAATEAAADEAGLVAQLRTGPAPDGPWVTIDNVDEAVGAYATVLGLERLLSTGVGGDYGYKAGAEALLPPR